MPPSTVATGFLDRVFQLADLTFVFDVYEWVSNRLGRRTRPLTSHEQRVLYSIFGPSLPYARIRIDERAYVGPRRYRFCYVSFHTINSWGPISPPTLVHEAVHVWQYVHFGPLYIPRALASQRSPMGYDYGGVPGLERADSLLDFNFEQMASVIEDAYRLRENYKPRFVTQDMGNPSKCYVRFVEELKFALFV